VNRFIKFLVSITLIATFSVSHSQQVVEIDVLCDDLNTVVKALLANNEQPIIVSKSTSIQGTTVVVWMNQQGEMTVTHSSATRMCILAAGESTKLRLPESKSLSRYY
jgi:hypothetical protein